MACTNCGSPNHYKPTCPELERDRALHIRIDGMTESESGKMEKGIQSLKKKHTNSSVRATMVSGKSKELPSKIKRLIGFSKDED